MSLSFYSIPFLGLPLLGLWLYFMTFLTILKYIAFSMTRSLYLESCAENRCLCSIFSMKCTKCMQVVERIRTNDFGQIKITLLYCCLCNSSSMNFIKTKDFSQMIPSPLHCSMWRHQTQWLALERKVLHRFNIVIHGFAIFVVTLVAVLRFFPSVNSQNVT